MLRLAPRLLLGARRCFAFGLCRTLRTTLAVTAAIAVTITAWTITVTLGAAAAGALATAIPVAVATLASAAATLLARLAFSAVLAARILGFCDRCAATNQQALEPAQYSAGDQRLLLDHHDRWRRRSGRRFRGHDGGNGSGLAQPGALAAVP